MIHVILSSSWYTKYLFEYIDISHGLVMFSVIVDYKKQSKVWEKFANSYVGNCKKDGIKEISSKWKRNYRDNRIDQLFN